jgi:hypothetical protein
VISVIESSLRVHGSFPWADIGYASAAFTVFVLPFWRRIVKACRNVWRAWAFARGTVGIDGVRPEVKAARFRVEHIEASMVTKTELATVVDTLVSKEDHKELVDQVKRLDDGQLEILRRITRNGGDTPDLGDTAFRNEQLLNLIADKLGVSVDPMLQRNARRRSDDKVDPWSVRDDFEGGTL